MRKIPPLSAVRVFECAARHVNFTVAADELGMTQAAVSYQIKLIEERLGVALFVRANRRVTLTPIGRRIAPLVSGAFDSLDDAFAMARRDDDAVLTVSCAMTFGPNWLAPRIGAFQTAHPELAVRLHTSNTLVDFARDDVDAAIRGGAGDWPGLKAHFLMRMPITALASPAYLASVPTVVTADDVLGLSRISPDDSWWTIWRECTGGRPPENALPNAVRLDSQIMEGQAALSGQGVAVLNPALWRREIDAGLLMPVLDNVAFDAGSVWLVYPEHKRGTPKIRAFRDWLLGEMARAAEGDRAGIFSERATA
jgi:LysR family transcriptional regulator, glycine cleavage system transcriptional activator